jgi:octaprenyl-diphosphate synthase
VQEIIAFAIEKGGVEYAIQRMNFYKGNALQILEDFPAGDAKEALKSLVEFVTDRKK